MTSPSLFGLWTPLSIADKLSSFTTVLLADGECGLNQTFRVLWVYRHPLASRFVPRLFPAALPTFLLQSTLSHNQRSGKTPQSPRLPFLLLWLPENPALPASPQSG